MADITTISQAQTMTSLQIAEITGKRHCDVMRAIRAMEDAWTKVNGRNFALVEYTDVKGEKRPCYNLTKTECLYIATKFNDEARAKLILRWEELEVEKQNGGFAIPQSFSEALMLAANQAKQIEQLGQQNQILVGENEHLTAENRQLAPKAQYTDEVLQSTSTYTLTQVAHDLGMRSVYVLQNWLMAEKILFRQSGQLQPTAKVADKGYFTTRTAKYIKSDGSLGSSMSTVVTECGRQWLHSQAKQVV